MLHLHPNTVGQRLSRVGKLLGPDWSKPDRALQIQLALQLRGADQLDGDPLRRRRDHRALTRPPMAAIPPGAK